PVAHQTYDNLEVVLVEDGARTLQPILAQFPSLRVNYLSTEKRIGRCEAGNLALRAAVGEYFLFLDEDDDLYADHVEQLVAEVLRSQRPVAYSFAFELPTRLGPDGDVAEEGEPRSVYRRAFTHLELFHHNYLPILTVLFHRRLFEEV